MIEEDGGELEFIGKAKPPQRPGKTRIEDVTPGQWQGPRKGFLEDGTEYELGSPARLAWLARLGDLDEVEFEGDGED